MLKISDVSKVLGISCQSIRNYEKMGIAEIAKDEATGYRHFNLRSLNQLLRVRFYRKSDFELSKTAELVNTIDLEFAADSLHNQQQVITEKIEFLEGSRQRLKELELQLQNMSKDLNKVRLWESPDFYYMTYFRQGEIIITKENEALIGTMIDLMPLANTSPVFRKINGGFKEASLEYGIICPSKHVNNENIKKEANYIPAQKGVYTIIKKDTVKGHIQPEDLIDLLDYAVKHKIKVDYIIGRTIICMREHNKSVRYHEFWTISE